MLAASSYVGVGMMLRLAPVLWLAATLPLAAHAADTRVPDAAVRQAERIRDAALASDRGWEILESLTTEVGHRMPGSEHDARGVEWAKAKFKALGYDKVWTQPATFPRWIRRSESARVVGASSQSLAVTALGGSPGGTVEAPVVRFDSLDALKAAPAGSLKGKILFVDVVMPHYGVGSRIRREGPREAIRTGASAFVMRPAGTDWHRNPHTGMALSPEVKGAVPSAALSNPDADQLARLVKRGDTMLHLALDCGFDGEYTSQNVIGEITGRERPREIVAIAAHLDSWDLGTGAIDDGLGIATTMAAGATFKQLGLRPARTVRVIAFANEEQGYAGGRVYAASMKDDVASHVIVAESDSGVGLIETIGGQWHPDADPAMRQVADVLAPLGIRYTPREGHAESEMELLEAMGVAAGYLGREGKRYFDYHHTPDDTLDKLDPKALRQNVAAYAAWTWMMANARGDFGSGRMPKAASGD